jgi:hypothetical protein
MSSWFVGWGAELPTGFGTVKRRLQLTGLEEPEELWERLKEATAEAQVQAAANKKLAARIQVLERQLSKVGELTDDELVAELPKRMTRALESAQVVAREIVGRAQKREAAICHDATERAAEIVEQAEGQAANMLSNAATQVSAHLASAESKAQEMIQAARARRKQVLTDMEREAQVLQQRIEGLQRNQARLLHAYEVVGKTLAEARRALSDGAGGAPGDAKEAPVRVVTGARPRSRAKPGQPAAKVYDWSPRATSAE